MDVATEPSSADFPPEAATAVPAPSDDVITISCKDLPELNSVELPCFVKSVGTAVSMVGGQRALENYVQAEVPRIPVFLTAPGEERDPLRAPLTGHLRPCQGIVLKLVRKVVKSRQGEVVSSRLVRVDALGKVDRSYQFVNPGDFQFTSAPPGCKIMCQGGTTEVLEAIPRPFVRKEPTELTLPLFAEVDFMRIRNRGKTKEYNQRALVVHLESLSEDLVIPAGPTDAMLEAANVNRRSFTRKLYDDVVLDMLKNTLFEARPIWILRGMEGLSCLNNFNITGTYATSQLLSLVAYRVAQLGAWQGSHVRYGYDPRKDPSSRWSQTMLFKVEESLIKDVRRKVLECVDCTGVANIYIDTFQAESWHHATEESQVPTDIKGTKNVTLTPITFLSSPLDPKSRRQIKKPPKVMLFGHEVKKGHRLQICDVMDESFFEFCNTVKRVDRVSEKFGWFTENSILRLRQLISRCVARRLVQFINLLDEKVYPVAVLDSQDVSSSSSSDDDISFVCSHRYKWYQRYCAIPDAIATEGDLTREQELMSTESIRYASEKEREGRSKRPHGSDPQIDPKRRRNSGRILSEKLSDVSATLTRPDGGTLEGTSVNNSMAATNLPGLQDVEAFDFFDDDDDDFDENDSQVDDSENNDSGIDDSGEEENIASGADQDSDNDSGDRERISAGHVKNAKNKSQGDSDTGADTNDDSGDGESSGSNDDDDDNNEDIEDENDDQDSVDMLIDQAAESENDDSDGFEESVTSGKSSRLTIFNV